MGWPSLWGEVPEQKPSPLSTRRLDPAAAEFSHSTASDPSKLLQEADRLAWLRAWGAAEALYAQAEKLFSANGDERNACAWRIANS